MDPFIRVGFLATSLRIFGGTKLYPFCLFFFTVPNTFNSFLFIMCISHFITSVFYCPSLEIHCYDPLPSSLLHVDTTNKRYKEIIYTG